MITRHHSACLALITTICVVPHIANAQLQQEPTLSAPHRAAWVHLDDVSLPHDWSIGKVPLWMAPSGSTTRQRPTPLNPAPPCRARGETAIRGLLWGAVVGGVVGFTIGQREEYGGAVLGSVAGGLVGAPLGMVTLLLLTPC